MTDFPEPLHLTDFNRDNIDLNRPFVEQELIQNWLTIALAQPGQPVLDQVLHLFLKIITLVTQQELNFLQYVDGIKFGYERAVAKNLEGNEYSVESRFVADEKWLPEYDLEIISKNKALFLSTVLRESHEEKTGETEGHPSADRPIDLLGKKMTDELLQLYPDLQNCKEFHVYVFRRIISATTLTGDRT